MLLPETDSTHSSPFESPNLTTPIQSLDLFQGSAFSGNHFKNPQTIAFIDPNVDDIAVIAAGLKADVKIFLDPKQDGIKQITEILGSYKALTGIEIISHGNTAELQLGKSSLDENSLTRYSQDLQQWGLSLEADADILIYGCSVADGEVGKAFVTDLSNLTSADVAASTDLTGNSAKGGDWDLEYATGSIETAAPFTDSLMGNYQGILPSLFTTQTPVITNLTDGTGSAGDYELGMEFQSAKAGQISSIRYYKAASETGAHVGKIWSGTGTLLASVTFANETASGWQQQALSAPLTIQPNTTYVVSVNANQYYVATNSGIATTLTNGDLSAIADGSNGVYNVSPGAFPTQSWQNSNYFRDIVFTPTAANPNNNPGTVSLSGTATQNQTLTATVADPDGLTGATINYQWQQSTNGTTWTNIAGATSQTLTLGQSQVGNQVRTMATYTDTLGTSENAVSSATTPVAAVPGSTTETLFTTQVPILTNATDGTGSAGDYELGMEFQSAKAGQISSIRYYKAASETGAHVGKIWSGTGTLLASVTFANETASGWQQQALSAPLTIQPNTTYVVSVNANQYYVATNSGIATTLTNGDLSAIADGSNGVYNVSPGAFPTQAYQNSNYFRDIVFTPTAANPNNNPGTVSLSGTVTEDQTLTATVTDSDGLTGIPVSYQWQQSNDNGVTWTNITGATSQTLTLGDTQVAKSIRAEAKYTDALGTSETVLSTATNPVININDVGLSILSGSATVDGTLNAKIFDIDGITGSTFSYQWQTFQDNLWLNIDGAIGQTLDLSSFLGNQVRAAVTYFDAYNTFESIFSPSTAVAAFNPIVLENQKAGTTAWEIPSTNQATTQIVGYADATSINKGQDINFKVSLEQAGQYQIDVYRLGYYGGTGGRLVASATGLNGAVQAGPTIDPNTRLVEYNWNTSYTLQTGNDWTSGLYFAKLTDSRTGKQNYIQFTLRDDNRPADIGFQDAIATAQAYNNYGGYSVYDFNSVGGQRAYQVSFDRPFQYNTSTASEQFNNTLTWEYNMTRWIESQGYDVSYYTNLDVSINPLQLYSQKTFLSVGHDEYWSREQRNNVEQARDKGTNLAFFSANTAYWQVRFAPSTSGIANRVMTVYKDSSGTGSGAPLDPIAQTNPTAATTLFRSPQVNRPENALLGVGYIGDWGANNIYNGADFVVSNASDPYYANTGLRNGDKLVGLVGYEWDAVLNNGFTPSGLVVLSQSPVSPSGGLPPLPPGTNTNISNAVRYTAASGAKVFSTGSVQWVWGLDSYKVTNPRVDPRAQQIAVNVFADMGNKPQTPNAGIIVPT
jgi:Domain of unknown function (DUF4347)/Domain of unknown function (DUF4082)